MFTNSINDNIKELAAVVGCPVEYFIKLMKHESGMNPKAINKVSGAVGLIQFLPSTLKGYGYTVENYLKLSISEQFKLIQKFYTPVYGKINSLSDLFLYNFWPVAVRDLWSDSRVIESFNLSAGLIASQNKGLDTDKSSSITVGEFRAYVNKKYGVSDSPKLDLKFPWWILAGVGLLFGIDYKK